MTHKFQKNVFCAKMGNTIKISHKNYPPKTIHEFSETDIKTFFFTRGSQKSKKSLKNDQKIKKKDKNSSKTLFFHNYDPPNMDILIWKPFLFFQKSKKISRYPKNKKWPINSKKTFFVPKWAILSKFLIKITPPKPYMNFQKKILKLFFLLGGSQKSKKSLKNDQKIKKKTKNGSKTLFFIIMTPQIWTFKYGNYFYFWGLFWIIETPLVKKSFNIFFWKFMYGFGGVIFMRNFDRIAHFGTKNFGIFRSFFTFRILADFFRFLKK